MPLYEYRCSGCGETFEEALWRMQDADTGLVCPKCQSGQIERLLSTFASRMGSAETVGACGAPASACGSGRFS